MSINATFKNRLKMEEALFGHWIGLSDPVAVEVMANLSCDFLLIDGEHAPIRPDDLYRLLPATDLREMPVIFRTRSKSEADVKAALDAGAAGLMIPMVETAAQARSMVDAAYYAPRGRRGIGPLRASNYYTDFDSYLASAADATTLIVQIESEQGLANVSEIAATDGVDVVYVGPADLGQSLGAPTGTMSDKLLDACETIAAAALQNGKRAAIDLVSSGDMRMLRKLGFSFFTHGSDIGFLQEGALRTCARLRDTLGQSATGE